MANSKITDLAALTTAEGTDLLAIVDDTDTATKKITLTNLKSSLALNNVDNTSDINKPVSTATQTALDLKQDLYYTQVIVDDDYTFVAGDEQGVHHLASDYIADIALTIPADATYTFPVGSQLLVSNLASGFNVSIVGAAGVTILENDGNILDGIYATGCAIKLLADVWLLVGKFKAA